MVITHRVSGLPSCLLLLEGFTGAAPSKKPLALESAKPIISRAGALV